jgi:hypothetical protein
MRSFTGKLLLSVSSLILTLSIVEVTFRILDYRGFHADGIAEWDDALMPKKDPIESVNLQFIPHSKMRLIYDGNSRG